MKRIKGAIFRSSGLVEKYIFGPSHILIDWLSVIVMCGWLTKLYFEKDFLTNREIYVGFRDFPQSVWFWIFLSAITTHLASIFYRAQMSTEIRFFALSFATGIWSFVTVNFMAFALSNLAIWTFGSLALICFTLGIRIAWTSSSHNY